MQDLPETISSWVSTGVMVMILVGLRYRHRPRVHVPIMLGCFIIDVANVVFIEVRRGAVEQAVTVFTGGGRWVLGFHIAVSVLSIFGYVIALVTGLLLLKRGKARRVHRANAAAFLILRVLNYVTSFQV